MADFRLGEFGVFTKWVGEVVFDAEGIEEGAVLEDEPYFFSYFDELSFSHLADVVALEDDLAGVGMFESDDRAQDYALSRARASEEA